MHKKQILIIEDDTAISELLCDTLTDEGYEVQAAANGRQGLLLLARWSPALIICDVMMPLVDGREVARQWQRTPAYHAIPLIMMSAAHEWSETDITPSLFLRKPFTLDEVLLAVERLTNMA